MKASLRCLFVAALLAPSWAAEAQSSSSSTTRLSVSGERSVPDTHRVERGDTLWDITNRYFGNPWEWPKIWSYNPEITNPHWIYPDDSIALRSDGQTPET